MKYVCLIYQGTTPLPGMPAWDELSPEEQKAVYDDYAAVTQHAGVTPGPPLGRPDDATTVRVGLPGDVDVAEEAAQDAFALATERWRRDGPPANPRAWLITTARNRAIDRMRRDRTLTAKLRLLGAGQQDQEEVVITDIPDE